MKNAVIAAELDFKEKTARACFTTPKYKMDFTSFACMTFGKSGTALVGVDSTMQCVAWNLFQLDEIRSFNLAAISGIGVTEDAKGNQDFTPLPHRIASNGVIYTPLDKRFLAETSLLPVKNRPFVVSSDVEKPAEQVPPKLSFIDKVHTRGYPFGVKLDKLFAARPEPITKDAVDPTRPQTVYTSSAEMGESRLKTVEQKNRMERAEIRSAQVADDFTSFAKVREKLDESEKPEKPQ